MKSFLFAAFLHLVCLSVLAQPKTKIPQWGVATLTVTFDLPPSVISVEKASLRYNKAFAYSFILDDGLIDAYSVAFPLLTGGLVTGNNTVYPGYYYSDGCGNAIPFSAGLSWYSVNAAGNDLHVNTPGYVTWSQLISMYNAGWNVLNHSYSHAANDTAIDYAFQITRNTAYVKTKSGIDLTHFAPPSGDQNYVIPAFANGMLSVTGNNGAYNGSPDGFRVDQPVDLHEFKLYKMLVSDANQDTSNIMQKIDHVAETSVNGQHYWWSDFTHHVGFQSSGASLLFPLFQFYMEKVAQQYGISGTDNIWMAPTQDVYEYLSARDNSLVNYSLSGNVLTITVDYSAVPANMRTYALTLNLESDQNFSSIVSDGVDEITYNGSGDNKLINLRWNGSLTSIHKQDTINNNSNSFFVYPNPFTEKLCINFRRPVKDTITFELLDMAGRTVFHKTVDQRNSKLQCELDLTNIEILPGIYVLRVVGKRTSYPSVKVQKINK
ncbi:MAG: T9SS type A sorting domain-containing protein [Bacteroidota bacterium]